MVLSYESFLLVSERDTLLNVATLQELLDRFDDGLEHVGLQFVLSECELVTYTTVNRTRMDANVATLSDEHVIDCILYITDVDRYRRNIVDAPAE